MFWAEVSYMDSERLWNTYPKPLSYTNARTYRYTKPLSYTNSIFACDWH